MALYEIRRINNESYKKHYINGGYEWEKFTGMANSKEEAEKIYAVEGWTVYARSFEEIEKNRELELTCRIIEMEAKLKDLKIQRDRLRRERKNREEG